MTTQIAAPAHEAERPQAAGNHTQIFGLVLLALAPLTMFVVGVVTGADIAEGAPFVVFGVLLLAASGLVGRFGMWANVVGIVLTVLTVLAGFWIAFGLMAVDSPADFVPAVLFLLGVGLALTGGVRAVRARRRETALAATPFWARAHLVVVVVVVLAAVVSVTANLVGRQTVDAAAADAATPVTIDAFDFATAEVTVAGPAAALLVSNRDAFLHDLAIPDHDLAVTVSPGSEALLDVSGLPAGSYTFYCTLHSDTSDPDPATAGMAGRLVVQ